MRPLGPAATRAPPRGPGAPAGRPAGGPPRGAAAVALEPLRKGGSGRPRSSRPAGSTTKVRPKGSAGNDCSQLRSAAGPPDSKARAACAYSWPRCTDGRSVRCAVALTATVTVPTRIRARSEEHTSELQSRLHLVCRLLLEKKH